MSRWEGFIWVPRLSNPLHEGLGKVVGNRELQKSLKGGVAQPGLVSAVPFKEGLP